MSLTFDILGGPGGDNAVLVRVDTGQTLHRLLFDCGQGCLDGVKPSEVQAVDHLPFSHLHMDHVGGFDHYFRLNFNRAGWPVRVWGPPRTGSILHHRFRGFLWNLHAGQPGRWVVHDIQLATAGAGRGALGEMGGEVPAKKAAEARVEAAAFLAAEAFATAHDAGSAPVARSLAGGRVIDHADYVVDALEMDHGTPSMAYVVRERPGSNVDVGRLGALGLKPGPWLRQVKEPAPGEPAEVQIDGKAHPLAELRRELLVRGEGESLAYLTDFRMDEAARRRLLPMVAGCTSIVCEAQYRAADLALAEANHHMTAADGAALARDAGVRRLLLFHVSERYTPAEWLDLLDEAKAIFPAARFPGHWAARIKRTKAEAREGG